MGDKKTYRVSFMYTRGSWRGKRVVPLDDNLQFKEMSLDLYSESQIKPVICEELKRIYGIKIPYIVDIDVLEIGK